MYKFKFPISLILLVAGFIMLSSCNDDDSDDAMPDPQSITDLAASNPDLSILASLLESNPDLEVLLDSDGDFTVFAPTNMAFTSLLEIIGQDDPANVPDNVLRRILLYHVVSGNRISSGNISSGATTGTALSASSILTFGIDGSMVTINDYAEVTAADIEASNGIVHKIDEVLIPELELSIVNTIVEPAYFSKDFSILTEAVITAGLLETLTASQAGLTLFAPDNAAFEAAGITTLEGLSANDLAPVLTYHVLEGEVLSADLPSTDGGYATMIGTLNGDIFLSNNSNGVFINGNSEITTVDIIQDNGIVHTINRTLLPASADIIGIATSAGFTDLAAALTEAGLVEALSDPNGPYTVFAPTNEAFQALYASLGISGPGEVDDVLGEGTLSAVLTYHVLDGRVFSSDLSDGVSPATLQSGTITINTGDGVTIADQEPDNENASVTSTDVLATNGVVHIIDAILLPADL